MNSKSQWTFEVQLLPNVGIITNVSVVDTSHVWVMGYESFHFSDTPFVAIRLSDGNWDIRDWFDMDLPVSSLCNTLAALTDSIAFVGTQDGKVYMTTNAGYNWTLKINAGSQAYVNDIRFCKTNKKYGYVFCDPPGGPGTDFKIYKTIDGGNNWTTLPPNFGPGLVGGANSGYVTDSLHAWYGLYCYNSNCNATKLAFTTNGGSTWQSAIMPVNSETFTSIGFDANNNLGYSSYISYGQTSINLYQTTTGGVNWIFKQNITDPGPSFLNSLISIPETSNWYFVCGITNPAGYKVFRSSNNGILWDTMSRNQNEWDQIVNLDAIKFGSKIYGWAVSPNSYIYRMIDSVSVIGVNSYGTNIPNSFSLSQNYPNPFNPTTEIKFGLPKTEYVTIQVFDIVGKQIAVLADNELKHAGEYSVKFDGSNYASGIYIYRIETEDFTDAKKMVLIK